MCVCVYTHIHISIGWYTSCNSFPNNSCPPDDCLEKIALSDKTAYCNIIPAC